MRQLRSINEIVITHELIKRTLCEYARLCDKYWMAGEELENTNTEMGEIHLAHIQLYMYTDTRIHAHVRM